MSSSLATAPPLVELVEIGPANQEEVGIDFIKYSKVQPVKDIGGAHARARTHAHMHISANLASPLCRYGRVT